MIFVFQITGAPLSAEMHFVQKAPQKRGNRPLRKLPQAHPGIFECKKKYSPCCTMDSFVVL